uniref:(northern house mosquito) hypothetical protein n=1 Tax=Culex pipiens TaxID=7175 RepID=A0A8D8NU10_CULPI
MTKNNFQASTTRPASALPSSTVWSSSPRPESTACVSTGVVSAARTGRCVETVGTISEPASWGTKRSTRVSGMPLREIPARSAFARWILVDSRWRTASSNGASSSSPTRTSCWQGLRRFTRKGGAAR